MKVAELAPEDAPALYTEASSRLEPMAKQNPAGYYAALAGLGRAQFRRRDLLGALASFSRALQTAESASSRAEMAESNLWIGTVLDHNGEKEAAAAKLRKAFELYRDLAGVQTRAYEESPDGYRKTLAEVATQAPPELRKSIEAQLRDSELN